MQDAVSAKEIYRAVFPILFHGLGLNMGNAVGMTEQFDRRTKIEEWQIKN